MGRRELSSEIYEVESAKGAVFVTGGSCGGDLGHQVCITNWTHAPASASEIAANRPYQDKGTYVVGGEEKRGR